MTALALLLLNVAIIFAVAYVIILLVQWGGGLVQAPPQLIQIVCVIIGILALILAAREVIGGMGTLHVSMLITKTLSHA